MYGRACTVTLNKGVQLNSIQQDWLNVKFRIEYNFNDNFASATIGICGLGKSTANKLLQHFAEGITQQDLKNATTVTLDAGYIGGGASIGHLFTGTAWDAKLSGTPDVWLNMRCSTLDSQINNTGVVVINKGMLLKDACTKICKSLLNVDCLWAVTNTKALEMKVGHWTSDLIKGGKKHEAVAEALNDLGGGLITCKVCNDLNLSPILVLDTLSDKSSWESVSRVCQLSQKSFSCNGNASTDGLVIGIPQPTVNGIDLDVQLDHSVKIGTLFTVQSNLMPMVNGNTFAVLTYQHMGELRGNEWKTHIQGISLNQNVYLRK